MNKEQSRKYNRMKRRVALLEAHLALLQISQASQPCSLCQIDGCNEVGSITAFVCPKHYVTYMRWQKRSEP